MVGHVQVYDEQHDPDKEQKRPDRRRYHHWYHHRCHHRQSVVWMEVRYARKGNIVGPK
jgi:hypothetical protein